VEALTKVDFKNRRHSHAGGNLKAYGITIPNQVGKDDATYKCNAQ
jgi:hypothetical protein